jgi:8-oxo-dGTP pyrophosphatase MutT (NUDIX family)
MKIINKLIDDQYDKSTITHTRKIARAILLNEENKVCLLHVLGDDDFGHRDYYETPGGGVNENELIEEAVIREIKEETGYNSYIIQELGIVEDYYNLIHRHNVNHYYLLKTTSYEKEELEEYEKGIIDCKVWVDIDTAISLYENMNKEKLEILVKNRELPILKMVKEILKGGEANE